MRKIAAYIVVISCSAALLVASSPYLMDTIDPWIPNMYRYGDMYHFANLARFKEQPRACPSFPTRFNKNEHVNLFILGDSYTEHTDSSNYNVEHYHFSHWTRPDDYIGILDSSAKNILIIESVERYFRDRFIMSGENTKIRLGNNPEKQGKETQYVNLQAEDNLIILLTYFDFPLRFREMKAWINWKVFGKIHHFTALSKDEKYIFFKETVEPKHEHSTYYPIPDPTIEVLVNNADSVAAHYKNLGFDEVYLSLIPDAASILEPSPNQNHLIERIQSHPKLTVPVIDIYSDYQKDKRMLYLRGDTHWNCDGKYIWFAKVDSILAGKR